MASISGPSEGPVAITGASGYIGSQLVKNLIEHGYAVRACVRDAGREDKVACLREIAEAGPGSLELFSCDLFEATNGTYDQAFAGCSAVFHVAADIGSDLSYGGFPSAERMYDSMLTQTRGLLESVRRSGTVKRVIYTSSISAVVGPGDKPEKGTTGHEFTEEDWAGGAFETLEQRHFETDSDGKTQTTWKSHHRMHAYSKGKIDAEVASYAFGRETGIDVVSCCPGMGLGPLQSKWHNPHIMWQNRIGQMLEGKSGHEGIGSMLWSIVDVRDVAESQRLMAESDVATNGSRYIVVSATEERGEVTARELVDTMRSLYPDIDVAGDWEPSDSPDIPRLKCMKAVRELGFKPHKVADTLKATGDTQIALGLVKPARK